MSVLDNLSPQIHGDDGFVVPDGVRFYRGCITDYDLVNEALENADVVFHLAAETGTGQSMYEISDYVKVNELGTAVMWPSHRG